MPVQPIPEEVQAQIEAVLNYTTYTDDEIGANIVESGYPSLYNTIYGTGITNHFEVKIYVDGELSTVSNEGQNDKFFIFAPATKHSNQLLLRSSWPTSPAEAGSTSLADYSVGFHLDEQNINSWVQIYIWDASSETIYKAAGEFNSVGNYGVALGEFGNGAPIYAEIEQEQGACEIIINEFFKADLNQPGNIIIPDFIELQNTSADTIDLSNWWMVTPSGASKLNPTYPATTQDDYDPGYNPNSDASWNGFVKESTISPGGYFWVISNEDSGLNNNGVFLPADGPEISIQDYVTHTGDWSCGVSGGSFNQGNCFEITNPITWNNVHTTYTSFELPNILTGEPNDGYIELWNGDPENGGTMHCKIEYELWGVGLGDTGHSYEYAGDTDISDDTQDIEEIRANVNNGGFWRKAIGYEEYIDCIDNADCTGIPDGVILDNDGSGNIEEYFNPSFELDGSDDNIGFRFPDWWIDEIGLSRLDYNFGENYATPLSENSTAVLLVTGCTDVSACNYDTYATVDDGSCEYLATYQCTDSNALNYYDSITTICDPGPCTTDPSSCVNTCTNSDSYVQNCCEFPAGLRITPSSSYAQFDVYLYPSYAFDRLENVQFSNLVVTAGTTGTGTVTIEHDGSDGENAIINFERATDDYKSGYGGVYSSTKRLVYVVWYDRSAMLEMGLEGEEMCIVKLGADENGTEGTYIRYTDVDAPNTYSNELLYPCQDNASCADDEYNFHSSSKVCYTIDCNGDVNGSATRDTCGVCSGGLSGHIADSDIDSCGICFGDGTSYCFNGGTCVDGTWDSYVSSGDEVNYNYGANPGTCTCAVNDTYAGQFCQCSNSVTCSGQGIVSSSGNCHGLDCCSCTCNGDAAPSEDGYCNDGSGPPYCETQYDCTPTCGGSLTNDVCGVCDGDGTQVGGKDTEYSIGQDVGIGDEGVNIGLTCTCNGEVVDYCGICGGSNTTACVAAGDSCTAFQDTDCEGTNYYTVGECDACGECFTTSGEAGSNPTYCYANGLSCSAPHADSECLADSCDDCSICGGSNTLPNDSGSYTIDAQCDCDGNTFDQCGVCGGDDTSCVVTCTDVNANNYDAGSCTQYSDPFASGYCIVSGTCTYQALEQSCGNNAFGGTGDATCDGSLLCCNGYNRYCDGTSGYTTDNTGECRLSDGSTCTYGNECCGGVCVNGTCSGPHADDGCIIASQLPCSADSRPYDDTIDGIYDQQMGADTTNNRGCSDAPPIGDSNPTIEWNNSVSDCINRNPAGQPDSDSQPNCRHDLHYVDALGKGFYVWGVCMFERAGVDGATTPTVANACCSKDRFNNSLAFWDSDPTDENPPLNYTVSDFPRTQNDCAEGYFCDECGVCRNPQCAADTNKTYYTQNPCPAGQEPQNEYWNSTCLDPCNVPNGSNTTGCMDSDACNYDATADCNPDNVCTYPGGQAVDGDWTNSAAYGSICDCDNTSVWGCDAVCGSGKEWDVCEQCAPNASSQTYFNDDTINTDIGLCDDIYGSCPTDYSMGCDGECYLDTYLADDGHSEILTSYPGLLDSCGVCAGNNSTCAGCGNAQACNVGSYTFDCTYASSNNGSADACCTWPTAPYDCSSNCCTSGNTDPSCDYHGQDYVVDCAGACNGSSLVNHCGVCNDGGTDTALTCESAGSGEAGDYCGDTNYCPNLSTGETYGSFIALEQCPTLDVCLLCDGGGYADATACGDTSYSATFGGGTYENYCCDCDGNLWDCCGICGGDDSDCDGECGPCGLGIAEGACDCDGNIETDCGCGATASLDCVDAGAEHQYCDDTTYCPDTDSDGSVTCVEQAYWNSGTPYCDCAGNAINGYCNGDGNTCNGSTTDACGVCGGDGSSCWDCMEVSNGNALTDICGNCVGGTSELLCPDGSSGGTCSNVASQSYYVDCANVCTLGTAAGLDLDDNSTGNSYPAALDDCGVCSGGNSGHVANSTANSCGVCPNGSCIDPTGLSNGQEACGDTFSYPGSVGTHNGITWTYANSTDCESVCFGFSETHTYPNNSGEGCCDVTELSNCGICDAADNVASTYPNQWNGSCDCYGDVDGTANWDDCQICSGGNTNHVANSDLDFCGNCHSGPLDNHGYTTWNQNCGVYFRFKHSSVVINTTTMKGSVDIEIKRGTNDVTALRGINLEFDSGTECGLMGCTNTEHNNSSTITLNGDDTDVINLPSNWVWTAGDSDEFTIISPGASDDLVASDTWSRLVTLNFNIDESVLSSTGKFEFNFNVSTGAANHTIQDANGNTFPALNETYPAIFFESDGATNEDMWVSERIGCMDSLAIDCDSQGCGCNPVFDTCVEHSKVSYCTYPSVDSINVYSGGLCSEDSVTICYSDEQCTGTCDVSTDISLIHEVSVDDINNILLSYTDGYVWHQNHKHRFEFTTTNLDADVSYWTSNHRDVEKILYYRSTPGSGGWTLVPNSTDSIIYSIGGLSEVYDNSSLVWDYNSVGSTKPISSGEYKLNVRWPKTSLNASAKSEQNFVFQINKQGCRSSAQNNTCDYGYNQYADIDCGGTLNGSDYESCCQKSDYLSTCCYLDEDDTCGICPNSETYNTLVDTWQDTDGDGLGCASSLTQICPNASPASGFYTADQLTNCNEGSGCLELGEACICDESNGFYRDELCWVDGDYTSCVSEPGTTLADDCGVCPNYTLANVLTSTTLIDTSSFDVYYNNSADCAGICYDGFKPIQEISGLLDRWPLLTDVTSFSGLNDLTIDGTGVTFDNGAIISETTDTIVGSNLSSMGDCDPYTYSLSRPYDNCTFPNIKTFSYWYSSADPQVHISTEWNHASVEDFDHEINIGYKNNDRIEIRWTDATHNNTTGSPVILTSERAINVEPFISSPITDDNWHHVVVSIIDSTYCSTNPTINTIVGDIDCASYVTGTDYKFLIWVDGVNLTPNSQPTPFNNMRFHHNLKIATGMGSGSGGGWIGKFKELRLYNKPLEVGEVNSLMIGTGGVMIGTTGHTFGAYDDECNVCSDGESGHTANENKDDCGDCHTPGISGHWGTASSDGNNDWNSNCADCHGTPNGDSDFLTDACGVCTCDDGGNCTNLDGVENTNLPNVGTCVEETPNAGMSCLQFDFAQSGYAPEISGCGVDTISSDCFVVGPDAGCSGICFVDHALDDIGQCCADGSKILVYPDYDLTSYSSPGVIGSGECWLKEGSDYSGCTGEVGFCLDVDCYNPAGIVDSTYCSTTCTSTWITAKPLSVCNPSLPGMEQPPIYWTGTIISLGEEQVSPEGYPYNEGDGFLEENEFLYYINTDICLGYFDACNECFSEEYLNDNTLDIEDVYNQGVTCSGYCYDGFKEDSCELWMGSANDSQCRDPQCIDFGYCDDASGDDYDNCSGSWVEYTFPDDYIEFVLANFSSYPPLIPLDGVTLDLLPETENYLSDACSPSDCSSGNCIPSNLSWNSNCTGCTDGEAKSTSYNEPCKTTNGITAGCLFDDGSCLYDKPSITVSETSYTGPNGEVIHGVVQNDIITEPIQFDIQFKGDNYFEGFGLTIKRSPDNSTWYNANLEAISENTGTENEFYFEDWFEPETMGDYSWPLVAGENVITLNYKVELTGVPALQEKISDTIQVNILKSSPSIDILTPNSSGTSYSSHDSIPIQLDYNGLYTNDSFISENEIQFRIIKPNGGILLSQELLPIDAHVDWDGSGEQAGYFYCPLDAPYGNDTNYYTSGIHIQFSDGPTCNSACVSPTGDFATCVEYHNIYTNLGYRWGYLWQNVWDGEDGTYTLEIEYPKNLYSCDDNSYCGNDAGDYAECIDDTDECTPSILASTTFDLTIVTGCIDATSNGYDGACNCVSCAPHECCVDASYTSCSNGEVCPDGESCVPSPLGDICQPTVCFESGFYNPYASVGFCADDESHCHDDSDCGASTCTFDCEYPVPGCTDNGEMQPGRCVTSGGVVTGTNCHTNRNYSSVDECHTLLDNTHSCEAQWDTFVNPFFAYGSPQPGFTPTNYNADATYNDGTCDGYGPICIYDEALNFYANTDITGWNVVQSDCVDENGNDILIADVYTELASQGLVTCAEPLNGLSTCGQSDCTITPEVMASAGLLNLLDSATDGGENDCVYGFTYKIGYEIFLLSGGDTLGEATLEHNGYVFLYDVNGNVIYDNLQQNSEIPLLIRKPRPYTGDFGGGPAGAVLKLWVEGPAVGDTGVSAKDQVKLMPPYNGEPGFPITSSHNGVQWTYDETALDNTVYDDDLCTEADSDCSGSPDNPIYIRIPEYDVTAEGVLEDESHKFSVTLTDPQTYGDGQYLSVTKDLYITYIRNNYWSYDVYNEDEGPLTLTYNPEGDESKDMLIDVNQVFGDDVDCSNPSDCIDPYTFTLQDLDSDLFIVDLTITPITGLQGALSAEPTQWIYDNAHSTGGGIQQENSIQFVVNDTGTNSPAGTYSVRLVASYAKNTHSTYEDIVYDYMLDSWCTDNLANDGDGICNGFESGHIVHNTPFIVYPQEQFIYTFNVIIVDTRGPQGEPIWSEVESFGISPDTWNFRPSGGDGRSWLRKDIDAVEGIPEQANISAGFGRTEYSYDFETGNVDLKCIVDANTINLIEFGYSQSQALNVFNLFDAASYEVADNLYSENGSGLVYDDEGYGFCSEDSIVTWTDDSGVQCTGDNIPEGCNPDYGTVYNDVDWSGESCQTNDECQVDGVGGTCIPWQEGVDGSYDFYDEPFVNIRNQFPQIYTDGYWSDQLNCFSFLSETLVYDYISPVEEVVGQTVEWQNPNNGGFLPMNSANGSSEWDTVWKYELFMYRCDPADGLDCYTENGTLLDYKVWQDHGNPTPAGTYHPLEYYIPPQPGSDQWSQWWTGPWQNMFSIFGHNDWHPDCPYNFTDGVPDEEFGFQPDSEGGGSYPECYPYACVTDTDADLSLGYAGCSSENYVSVWEGTVKRFIEQGHTFRFNQEGLHKVKICAYDLFWDPYGLGDGTSVGCSEKEFNIDYIIPIEQSVKESYNPWKGINVPQNELSLINLPSPKSYMIEYVDLDQRPSLGTYTFTEDNPWYLDWNAVAKDNIGGVFGQEAPTQWCTADSSIDSYVENYEEICDSLEGELYNTNFYDFSPDCDVRSIQTLVSGSTKSSAYEYYDEFLQSGKYFESATPTQVQFYFYPRESGNLYDNRSFYGGNSEPANFDKDASTWFLAFLDFGDGSDPLYTTAPRQLHKGAYIHHTYQKAGIFNVTGWMLKAGTSGRYPVTEDNVSGIVGYKKFRTIVNLHPNPYHEDEFEALGGSNYTFIPSRFTNPVIGGISPNSVYAKTLIRKLGYSGTTNAAKISYQLQTGTYREQLDAEYALAKINENLVGSEISKFTGSFAHDGKINGSYPIISDSFIEEYGTGKVYYSNQVTGFVSGSNIDVDGSIIYDANDPPVLINRGWFTGYGELGNDIGNADMGQVRYFQHPMSMWEMLGFESPTIETSLFICSDNDQPCDPFQGDLQCAPDGGICTETIVEEGNQDTHPGNPASPRFWQNIKPTPYELWEREGITMDSVIPGKINFVDTDSSQQWSGNNTDLPNNSTPYYYPVLPKLNYMRRFDESLGLQTDSSGNQKIPFGSITYWKDKDDKAPITNNTYTNEYLLMDLDFTNMSKNAVEDKSGTSNKGVLIGDYKVKYDEQGNSSRGSQATIGKLNKDGQQF